MAFKIKIKPIVYFDLEEAISWYEGEQKGLGERFFRSFSRAIEKIKKSPNFYLTVIPGVKRVLLKKFPYKIFYTITENTLFIIGLTHEKRGNAFVKKRLKSL